jgi:hypothetical protein
MLNTITPRVGRGPLLSVNILFRGTVWYGGGGGGGFGGLGVGDWSPLPGLARYQPSVVDLADKKAGLI